MSGGKARRGATDRRRDPWHEPSAASRYCADALRARRFFTYKKPSPPTMTGSTM